MCLKEKNRLLSDRLYYGQVGMAMPDGSRHRKVRRTMAGIKRVLWERSTAVDAMLKERGTALAPADPAYSEQVVQIKKFGRKYTVPVDHPYAASSTRAERQRDRRRILIKARYDARQQRLRDARASAVIPPEVAEWYRKREQGRTRVQTMDDIIGRAAVDQRFDGSDDGLLGLRARSAKGASDGERA